MAHARLAASIVRVLLLFVVTLTRAAQPPISSPAELTRYLRDTPPGASPLDALSPGGRKRLLAQLQFGERGLRSISLDDAANELTTPQIVQLLTLFGAQDHVPQGLAPVEQARRKQERVRDAAARGCTMQNCAETEVERRYDELVLHKIAPSTSDLQRVTLTGERYDRLFGEYQTEPHLRSATAVDLRLITRAVERAVERGSSPAHVAQWQMDLAEMQRRGMLVDKDYLGLHRALISTRNFAGARALAQRHLGMEVAVVPAYRPPTSLPADQPTALSINAQNETMQREPFDLSAPLRIVVVASCHFSRDAARAIEADVQLRPIFARDAIWLASQNESFDAVKDWNREFPDQPIHVAWQNSEWSMLDNWRMPTFYVFRHGQLVTQFSGWDDLATLKQSLREAGVLH